MSSFQTKSRQTSGSVFADRIRYVTKTKSELEENKKCFLDDYGSLSLNSLTFDIKSAKAHHFCEQD